MRRNEMMDWVMILGTFVWLVLSTSVLGDWNTFIGRYVAPISTIGAYALARELRTPKNMTYFESKDMAVRIANPNPNEAYKILEEKVKNPSEFKRVH